MRLGERPDGAQILLVVNAKDMFAAAEFADEKAYGGQTGRQVMGTQGRSSRGDWTAGLAVYETPSID